MFLKKISIAAIVICLMFTAVIVNSGNDVEVKEIRYRCRLESSNPLWHILFFLFSPDNREFLWREKSGSFGSSHFREIELFNKSRRVIRFFNRGINYEAEVNFGADQSGRLNPEQVRVWFEMWDFVRLAQVGEKYETLFRTSENFYAVTIEAKEKCFVEISRRKFHSIYFEGKIIKATNGEPERFLDIKLWVAESGELAGRVIRCSFKKSFWPPVMIEIEIRKVSSEAFFIDNWPHY